MTLRHVLLDWQHLKDKCVPNDPDKGTPPLSKEKYETKNGNGNGKETRQISLLNMSGYIYVYFGM